MPLSNDQLRDVQRRVLSMLVDTIDTLESIESHAEDLFGERATEVRAAINEYLDDFWRDTERSREIHPEGLIYGTTRESFQKAGFYGAQLSLKERQVTEANRNLRESISERVRRLWRRPFKQWVDVINNFLGSLVAASGLSEALKELKDCLRDELPEDDQE